MDRAEVLALCEQYADWDIADRRLFAELLEDGVPPMEAAREVGRIDN